MRDIDLPGLITASVGLLSVLGAAIAWMVRRRDSTKPTISRRAADMAAVNEAVGGALTIVQENLTKEIDRLNGVNRTLIEELKQLQATSRDTADKLDDCDDRLTMLEKNENLLIGWITRLHTGIENGTIPPLPPVPAQIADLVKRPAP